MKLFETAACFTDIHFGLKHNSPEHNQDCIDFLNWFVTEAKKKNAETCIFLGDWHHHRSTINVSTLNYTIDALDILNKNFKNIYFIVGNHDLYYREKRDIHSIVVGKNFSNIQVVDKPLITDDVAILPWLVEDEWKQVVKLKNRYIFGHFELPGFKMNAMLDMADLGGINAEYFKEPEYIFSGHFHKRQFKNNVHYIGNPFGHSFSDVWDFDRGAMFLKWGGVPEYVNYAEGPRYISLSLQQLLDNTEHYLKPKTYASATIDINISYEEAGFLRETLIENYKIRELKLIPAKEEEHSDDTGMDINFETIDQIVIEQLESLDSNIYDKNKLIDIYNHL